MNKLIEIFTLSLKSSTIKIHVSLPKELEILEEKTNSKDCFIHIDAFSKAGTLFKRMDNFKSSKQITRYVIIINSSKDNYKEVPSL